MSLYPFVKWMFRFYYFFAFRIRIIGKENVPKEGGCVLCCNHSSNFDPVTMGIYVDRLPRYIAKKELFNNKLFGAILRNLKAFPVDREATMDMKAFKNAIKVLKDGHMLGIFAEGTRVKPGEEKAAKAGVAMFAIKGDAPVVPVAITGDYKFRSTITMRFGKPMYLEEYRDKKFSSALMEEITENVMAEVRKLKVGEE